MEYREIAPGELDRALFRHFERRQEVTKCRRRENGVWVVRDAPFIDDWSEADYAFLVQCLQNTLATGGVVLGAFADGALKGFASVESAPLGKAGDYRDLTCLHVSAELRGRGIVPFPVSWTVKMKKKQKETQDILSYHTQAAGCSDKARAKASGGRQPIEECGRTGL